MASGSFTWSAPSTLTNLVPALEPHCHIHAMPAWRRPSPDPSYLRSSGRWLPASFPDMPLQQREAVLLGWATGSDMRMRKVVGCRWGHQHRPPLLPGRAACCRKHGLPPPPLPLRSLPPSSGT